MYTTAILEGGIYQDADWQIQFVHVLAGWRQCGYLLVIVEKYKMALILVE